MIVAASHLVLLKNSNVDEDLDNDVVRAGDYRRGGSYRDRPKIFARKALLEIINKII